MSHKQTSLLSVFLTYFIDMFGLAIPYPIFTPLFLSQEGGFFSLETPFFHRTALLGILIALFPLAQFFGAPLIGEISDRLGRKRAFSITILGTALGYGISALSISFHMLPLLFFSRLFTGFFAGNLAICFASVADMSPDEKARAKNFGIIGGIGGLGFIAAILVGSGFQMTPSFSFWLLAILSLGNLAIMRRLFYESHPKEFKKEGHLFRGIPHILTAFQDKDLRFIYIVFFLFMFAWINSMQFLPTLLVKNYGGSQTMFMIAFLLIGGAWSLSNLFLNRLLARVFSASTNLKWSLLILSILLLLETIPHSPPLFLLIFAASTAAASLSWTNCLTIVSLNASKEIQGRILGINQSIGALAAITAPIFGGFITGAGPSLIYLFSGGATLGAAFVLYTRKNWQS